MLRTIVMSAAVVALLAACEGSASVDDGPSAVPVTVEVTVTEAAAAAPTVTATAVTTVEATVVETVTASSSAELPTAVTAVQHGSEYWGVYAAVGDYGDAALDDAEQRLADLGYEVGAGDISCDQGAREALGTDAPAAVAVHFEDADDAFDLAAALDPPPVGVARITAYCAD